MSITNEIERLQTAKSDLKTSINAKTDAQHQITTETIDDYADFVDSISTGSSKPEQSKTTNPSTSQVVVTPDTGYTLSSVTVNAMPIGALNTPTINSSTGLVTATIGTSGYLASGTNKTLQLSTQSAQTITPTTNNQIIESGKYLTGTQTISGDTNLVAENIKKDVTIFGVTGTHEGGGSATLITKSITQNGTYNASSDNADGYSQVTVNVEGGGTVEPEEKDVNFYDYDGTRLYSYTKSEFLELTEMPENPTHEGLTAQGWNWTLSTAKTYVQSYDLLDVGQNCITSDGKTKIKIKLEDYALKPCLGLGGINGSVEIDWGDGSQIETITGSDISTIVNTPHTYSSAGNYTIQINPVGTSTFKISGPIGVTAYSYLLNDNTTSNVRSIYNSYVNEIYLGKNIVFGKNGFSGLKNLKKINIPKTITESPNGFSNNSVKTIVIPQGIKILGIFKDSKAKRIILPEGLTRISQNSFSGCLEIKKLIIPSSVTTIETYACSVLDADLVVMPYSITSMKSYAFQALKAGEIKGYTYCASESNSGSNYLDSTLLKKIKLKPCSTIVSQAFKGCTNLELIDCSEFTSIPSANVSNVFGNVPNTCKLIVPASLYESWSSNSSWANAFDIISA